MEEIIRSTPGLHGTFFAAPRSVYEFVNFARESAPTGDAEKMSKADLAGQILLARMQQDYRACHILANFLYTSSAASVASSIYENFYILTSIVSDESLSEVWHDYGFGENFNTANLKSGPEVINYGSCRDRFYKLIYPGDTIKANEAKERSRSVYTHLSAYRHGNPAMSNKLGFFSRPEVDGVQEITATSAPVFDGFNLGSCAYALYHSGRYMLNAAWGYAGNHGRGIDINDFRRRFDSEIDNLNTQMGMTRDYLKQNFFVRLNVEG